METSIWLGDSVLRMKVITLRQRWTVGAKLLLLPVTSLAWRKKNKSMHARVKAAHSTM